MRKILFLTLYFLSPVLLIAAIFASNPGYYGSTGFMPMVLGATAYTFLNAQLILSARPKWIERYFGLDRLYRFHTIMAIAAIALAFIHKLTKEALFPENLQTKLGDLAIFIFIAASVLALVFMADTLVKRIRPLRQIRIFFTKLNVGKYHVQVILHSSMVVAVILIFLHVMLTYSAANPLVRAMYILYFSAAIGFYIYHKIIRPFFRSKRFVVEQVKAESESITTLTLRPQSGKIFPYLPGQFGFLRIADPSVTREEHPFSISSQPGDQAHLTITIKNLGDWTGNVQKISPGSKAYLDAPYGVFSPILYDCKDGIVLIAGGVGITPMLSILRYYRQTEDTQKIILLWGATRSDELICRDEFQVFQKDMPNFSFIPILSNEPEYEGEKGYVTQAAIEHAIEGAKLNPENLHYFICGPAAMQNSVKTSLKNMRIKSQMIHNENFSL